MLEDLSDSPQEAAAQAQIVGSTILNAIILYFNLAGVDRRCTASIGITLLADHQETIADLLKQADLSMYQPKASGRNSPRFFNQDMQAAITERTALEADLAERLLAENIEGIIARMTALKEQGAASRSTILAPAIRRSPISSDWRSIS